VHRKTHRRGQGKNNTVSTNVKTAYSSKSHISAFSDKGIGETICAMAIIPVKVKLKTQTE
jgi:hypothetical protein